MQIVIDISEKDYVYIAKKHCLPSCDDRTLRKNFYDMITNGTPLPIEHGRLIDASELNVALLMGELYGNKTAIQVIDEAPTIIEADRKGVTNGKA